MENMAAYVNHVIESFQKLRGTEFYIDNKWVGSLLLAGLPERFQPMIMAIKHSGMSVTADAIKSKLLDMSEDEQFGNTGSGTGRAFAERQEVTIGDLATAPGQMGVTGQALNVKY